MSAGKSLMINDPSVLDLHVQHAHNRIASVEILGVKVHCIDLDGLLKYVCYACRSGEPHTILYVNAHCFNLAHSDRELHHLLGQADLIITDGVSVVWSSRLLDGCELTKITGSDWFEGFCELAERESLRIFIVAGRPGVALTAVDNMLYSHPDLNVVGVWDGFFTPHEESRLLAEIQAARPDVLLAGLGTPKQEKLIDRVQAEIGVPVCWAVGATIDYIAGLERRAPRWIQALGLEWFWRLLLDPRSKWKRYLVGNPLFVWRVLRQKFGI